MGYSFSLMPWTANYCVDCLATKGFSVSVLCGGIFFAFCHPELFFYLYLPFSSLLFFWCYLPLWKMTHPSEVLFLFYESHVWFPENLKENVKERKWRGKVERKEKWRKIKSGFKINKLFLCVSSSSFQLFSSII